MKVRSFLAAVPLVAALIPGLADAGTAYTTAGLSNMRTGPGTNHPVIARVAGGSRVEVTGCLENFDWCDSVVQGMHGWISSSRLEFMHAGQLVPLRSFYTFFNIPIIVDGGRGWTAEEPVSEPDCSDPYIICEGEEQTVEEGPVECEACPWPTGRRPPR